MSYDASDPDWPDRDRFILSNGHTSILLYSMLYLTGTGDLTLDDLKQFRQWGSKTPGHPEAHHTLGVEVTTGPLGQGFANGVGMGIAERYLRSRFGTDACDHHTFVIPATVPRGGHQPRSRITRRTPEARPARLRLRRQPHHDRRSDRAELQRRRRQALRGIRLARRQHRRSRQRHRSPRSRAPPCHGGRRRSVLVILRSHIGWPSPKYTDTEYAHGNPFGEDEVRVTKEILGLPPDETFCVPEDVLALYRELAGEAGRRVRNGRSASVARHRSGGAGGMPCRHRRRRLGDQAADLAGRRQGRDPQGERRVHPGARGRRPGAHRREAPTSPATPARSSRITACSPRTSPAAARSTSACASTAWLPR